MSISDKPATLRAQMKHHEPIVCYAVKIKQIDMRTSESTAHPLDGNDDKEPQAVCYSPPPAAFMGGQGGVCYVLEGNTVDRNCSKNGKGWCENVSPTLNTQDRHAVCYAVDCRNNEINKELSGTLQAHNCGGWSVNCTNPVLYENEKE